MLRGASPSAFLLRREREVVTPVVPGNSRQQFLCLVGHFPQLPKSRGLLPLCGSVCCTYLASTWIKMCFVIQDVCFLPFERELKKEKEKEICTYGTNLWHIFISTMTPAFFRTILLLFLILDASSYAMAPAHFELLFHHKMLVGTMLSAVERRCRVILPGCD